MAYFINDIDLITFDLKVEAFSGFEVLPKRKGSAFYNFPDRNGIDPWLDADNVFFESRDIIITLIMDAESDLIAQVNFINFWNLLQEPNEKRLTIDRLSRTFVCMYIDQVEFKPLTPVKSGRVAYRGDLKLKEINPNHVLYIFNAIDTNLDNFVDFDGDNFTING